MSLTIGDIVWEIAGDLAGFNKAMKKAEETADKTGDAIGKRLKTALSPANLLADFGKGMVLGAGIAGFNALTNAVDQAVNAIPNLIQQGIKFGNIIDDLTDVTGASDIAASHFAGQWEYTGGTLDNMAGKFRAVTQEIQTNEAALNTLGITTKGADGRFLDTLTILDNARVAYQSIPDAVTKAAFAISFMGRTGLDATDFLKLTTGQVSLLNDELDRMGYTVENAAEFESLARETKLWDMAWQGLARSLAEAVLPALRQVLANIKEFVVVNGPQIKAVLADIVNFIGGVVSGLTGMNITPFQMQMDALGGSTGQTVLGFEAWAVANGKVIPQIKAATGGVSDLTKALDKQTAALDKQLERERAVDSSREGAFQRQMGRLAAVYGAQLTQLDADEAALEAARAKQDLAIQLAAAQEDLRKAQSAGPGGAIDFAAEEAAHARILEIQAQQREATRTADVADRRKGLEDTKAYIEAIATLESSSENKKALARNLATREKTLEGQLAAAKARGDADEAGRLAAKIEALKTAEARTQEAIRSKDKQTALQKQLADIATLKAAQSGANAAAVDDGTETLATLKAEYNKYVAGLTTANVPLKGSLQSVVDTILGLPQAQGAATAGPIAQAFIDGKAKAEEFETTLSGLVTGAQDLAKWLGDAWGNLVKMFDLKPPQWFIDFENFIRDTIGSDNPARQFFEKQNAIDNPDGTMPKYQLRAAGGPVHAGQTVVVGERGRPELVTALPGGGAWVTALGPSIAPGSSAMSVPAMGGDARFVLETHVYIGDREVVDLLDEALARRRRP